MVPHPQSCPCQVSQRPPTRPASTPTGGLTLHAKVELISSQGQAFRLPLPELGLRVQAELAGDRVLHRARRRRCRAQPPPDRAVRPLSRDAAAPSAGRASGRGDLRIALGFDLRALSLGNAGREGDPAAGGYQVISRTPWLAGWRLDAALKAC